MERFWLPGCRRSVMAALLFSTMLIGLGHRPAAAAVTSVKGSACGYYAKVGLIDGYQLLRGCGQPSGSPATAASPSVTLPSSGSAEGISATDADGAKVVYGPATLFGGLWPPDVTVTPPSGPLRASTTGTPAGGTVTSSADIALHPDPLPVRCSWDEPGDTSCEVPGGFGPAPVEGDSLHVECEASEGAVSGTTRIVNGVLTTSTDDYGAPIDSEIVPSNPPVNYTRSGTMTNPARDPDGPGDVWTFTVVLNQQIVGSDGRITVNGVHIYLFGPTGLGEVVMGQATCGTTPHPAVPADRVAPGCGPPVIALDSNDPSKPLTELMGVFDAGGLQSITNIQASNATVQVGDPSSSFAYRKFTPGQTLPLQMFATRTQEGEDSGATIYWSFDATDKAGNTTRCQGLERAPVAANDAYSTSEGTSLDVAAPGVLANDTRAAGAVLTAAVANPPANGALALRGNGSFTYTPNAGFSGTDTFTYTANDGSADSNVATVTLTVISVNRGPTCSNATLTTDEDTSGSTSPACTDADGGNLSYSIVGRATSGTASMGAGNQLTYTPDPDFAGTDTFTYKASDGTTDSNVATVSVTVIAVNDAPTCSNAALATDEDTPASIVPACSDIDGGPLTYSIVGGATSGTASVGAANQLTYAPHTNFHGADGFTYKANDGTVDSNLVNITVTVNPVNDAPVAGDDASTTAAGTQLTVSVPGLLGNDSDVDGDPLSAGSASDPVGGSVTLNGDGSFTYTPDPGFSGTDTFTYSAADGRGGSDVAAVTITVSPPPDLGPTTLSIADTSVVEGDVGTTTATFTVTRSGNASGASTVKFKTSNGTATSGSDYAAAALSTLSFAAGETSRAVTVNLTGDTLPEANETFTLVLSAPTGAALADTSGTATILNDDGSAYLAVDSVTLEEGSSGTTPATFTVTRSGNTTGASTVKYATVNGTAGAADFNTVASTLLSFAGGERSKTVTVDVIGDTVDEKNETFNLVLSGAAGATISDTTGTATIVDDEGTITPGPATFLSVGDLWVDEGSSGGSSATFTVTRSGTTSGTSAVRYTTSGGTATAGTDYTAPASGTLLSFAAGETSKTVTLDVTADNLPEANETFNLVLSSATGAAIADAAGTATIVNDDGAAYLTVGDLSVLEGSSGTTTATFNVTRSGNTAGSSTVKVKTGGGTATAGSDYGAILTLDLTFTPGETTKTVTIDITADSVGEPTETFNLLLVTPSGATISDASGTAKIVNDD